MLEKSDKNQLKKGAHDARTMHDSQHHISFRQSIGNIPVTGMRAAVNDAVHVQVEMVEFRQQGTVRDNLIDLWIALRDPAVELLRKQYGNREWSECDSVQDGLVQCGEARKQALQRLAKNNSVEPATYYTTFASPLLPGRSIQTRHCAYLWDTHLDVTVL